MAIGKGSLEGVVMDSSFWQGRKVLITGHTGFKGGWLALWLEMLGADVTGYALAPPTDPSLFETAKVAGGMRSITGDIRDLDTLKNVLRTHQPEVVFHLAAQSLVRLSYRDPLETYSTNVMGTVTLFEAIRNTNSVRAVVNVTSDKCYENREWVWGYREDEPMGGSDPYSNSKGCAELLTTAYRRSFFPPERYGEHGLALGSARAGNVIGGGDWAQDRLVPDAMQAFLAGKPVMIRNPAAVRPWQHVLEPLSGYLMLAERLLQEAGEFADGWNFGPNEDDIMPVSTLVTRLSELWGKGAHWVQDKDEHPHEALSLRLDSAKARHQLNWHPRWNIEGALQAVVEWFAAYRDGRQDMRTVTQQQIIAYQDSV